MQTVRVDGTGSLKVKREESLTSSPGQGPENESAKHWRKEDGGEVEMGLPQAKKLKVIEQLSRNPDLEATVGVIAPKEEPEDKYTEGAARMVNTETPFSGLVPKFKEVKEEVKYNIKREWDPLVDLNVAGVLVKKEESEDESDVEDDQWNMDDAQDIIAGKKRISFFIFKGLVESGNLKKEDLASMKSTRVIEVPGEGEVIQFMRTSVKNFNKIDLKELSTEDVHVHRLLWTGVPGSLVDMTKMFSKKGTTLTCKPCGIIHPDATSATSHIFASHANLLSGDSSQLSAKFKAIRRKAIRTGLGRLCDPSLLIEEVTISRKFEKELVKASQRNIYEEAAYLVSHLVHPTNKKKVMVYLCKLCGTNVAPGAGVFDI